MLKQISIRIDEKLIDLVKKVSENRGEDFSHFVRRSIRAELANLGYLDEAERKALGVSQSVK